MDMVLSLIKQMEATLLGLRQMRGYVSEGAGQHILAELISEAQQRLDEVRQKLMN